MCPFSLKQAWSFNARAEVPRRKWSSSHLHPRPFGRKHPGCHGKVQRSACYLTDSYRNIFSKYGFLKKNKLYKMQITAIAVVGSISIFNSGPVPKSALQIPAIGLDLACRWKPVNAMDKRLDACTCNGGWQKFQMTLAGNKVGGKKPDQFRTGQDTSCNCRLEAWLSQDGLRGKV